MRDRIVGPSRRALGVLLAAALVVLLITWRERREPAAVAIVASGARRLRCGCPVGSGPLRVVRQLLAEAWAMRRSAASAA
jgi:hypothetical protein